MPPNDDDEDDRPRKRPADSKGSGDDDRPRKRPRDGDEDFDDDRPRKRKRFEDEGGYEDDRPRPAAKQGSNGLALTGLILGLLSFCTVGLSGLPGIVCSLIALSKPTGRGLAVGGLLASGLGILAWIGLGAGFFFGVKPAVERTRDQNNMKRLGIALHNQHDAQQGFYGPYARDTMGTPNTGLSFRVGLLPYLEQENVYRQFDTGQAWNSARNQSASNTKLTVFTSPYSDEPASTNTPYRVFYGGGALFNENGTRVSMLSITDGTSNTIMAVHAAEQVPWAEPREFKYSPIGPLPKLGQPGGKGAIVLLADGSVRFVSNKVSDTSLRAMITKNGGEMITGD
ncbi:MAG TPA: DUF1559 domain-containing protein [Gemmata sp.]